MNTDPMERMARVREEFAKQQAKLPAVDHNGVPIAPPPAPPEPPAPAPTGVPAPNPALGSSASGDTAPTLTEQIEAAQKAGDWCSVLHLIHSQMTSGDAA